LVAEVRINNGINIILLVAVGMGLVIINFRYLFCCFLSLSL
jgi:hypothetical protein